MSGHSRYCLILVLVSTLFMAALQAVAEDRDLAAIFAEQNVDGTIVISSLNNGKQFIHNDSRATQRFAIASTFKIMNTLIALEEGVISGKDHALKWDGHVHGYPDWNHDQTLESAFKVSCVWYYQELARRIGAQEYRYYLQKWQYGVLREPFDESSFWLDGSLQISAVEQVSFLEKIHLRTLPFKESSYETLREIMVVEQTPGFTLRAKTGWAARVKPQIGWYVGYVETQKDVWFFAMNMEVRDEKHLPLRQALTRKALQVKKVIKE